VREVWGRPEADLSARSVLAQSLMRTELLCPACSGRTTGGAVESLWHDDVFWQIRSCPRCGGLLVATTPVAGMKPGPTHCARLTI